MAPSLLCRPFDAWPERDRAAWEFGCAPGDPFDDTRRRSDLRPATLHKYRRGYGRWLAFLDQQGWLDPEQPALARVTRGRLRAYARELRHRQNAPYTIIGRFGELRRALQIMAPGVDTGWVVRPFGSSIYTMLPKTRRPKRIPDCSALYRWALDMMDQAARPDVRPTRSDAIAFRDGLLIAMLSCRARRLRSMTLLRIGREFVPDGLRYRIELDSDHVKTGKRDSVALPEALTPYIGTYLKTMRPILLAGATSDAMWISQRRTPLTEKALAGQISKRSKARFDFSFGPHAFRHALATSAVLRAPESPGLAAEVLGISPGVVEKHYNLAGEVEAIQRWADILARRRRALRID